MLMVGPSKAGKSFLLMELAICIAEGKPWLGHQCKKGRVMYVNLEVDDASCKHRMAEICQSMGLDHLSHNLDIWPLRGKAVPMDKLTPKLIRRAQQMDYAAIILDPLYKVITGDENSASDMAAFCNQFDRICNETGCSALAKAGSGDCLTGIIAGLLAQGMEPFDAAVLGAKIHGLAGEIAATELSEYGVLASDLPRYIARAILKIQN